MKLEGMTSYTGSVILRPDSVRRNTIIQIVIVTIAFILLVRIWPCGLVQNHMESRQRAYTSKEDMEGESFTATDKKLQTVYFAHEHLNRMTMYLDCTSYGKNDYILFRIYNSDFSCIYEYEYSCSRIAEDGFLSVEPDLDVDTNVPYYYEVLVPEESSVVLGIPTGDRSTLAQTENEILYIDGIINENVSLVADFDYTKPLTVWWIILYDVLILAAAVFIMWGIILLIDRMEPWQQEILYYGRWAVTGMIAIAALCFFYFAVIRNVFGGEGLDRVVYTIAIAAGIFWMLCLVWLPKAERRASKLSPGRQSSLIWRNYIQTVSFGLLFYALCQYVNADREYYHYVNTRWMLIFLGIALLMIYTEKEFCNLVSGIYLGISIVAAFFYCSGKNMDEQELYLAKLTAGVVVVWGLVLINTLLHCKKGFWKQISKPFLGLWLVYTVLMYFYRYEKAWVFTATLPFMVLLLYNLSAAGKSRLLKNFTNGILLSFGFTTLFCLQHRPYHFWMLYRYAGFFHTVACTGMYLAVVLGAALAKLFGRLRDKDDMGKRCWVELFYVGTVVGFLLLTMSRTALLTAAVNVLMVLILAAVTYRKNFKRIARECGLVISSAVICFPLVFSAARIVPALVNDPVRYSVESDDRSYMIYEGDAINSGKYMNIERFLNLFFVRFKKSDGSAKAAPLSVQPAENDMLSFGGNSLPVTLPTLQEEEEERNYVLEEQSDISNGRFEIFMDYLKRLSLEGHPLIGITGDYGEDYAHAHNSYLQVAYNFGIPAGIVFLVLCAVTLWKSVLLFYHHGKKYSIYMVPYSLIVVFGFISLTEWAFHPCIPAGFSFLFVQMLLMQEGRSNKG